MDEKEKKLAALNGIFGILSDEEAAEMRTHCHLKFREVEPWSISLTQISFGIEYQTRFSLDIAARNYAALKKTGQTIEDDDLLIGSLAIAEGAILVTNNTEHLSRLKGIQLEDWTV